MKAKRIAEPRTHLDRFAPEDEFHEIHSIRIRASRDRIFDAIKKVTADEIRFYRILVRIRRMGRIYPPGMLNPPKGVPILQVATGTIFRQLAETRGSEILVGCVVIAPPNYNPGQGSAEDFTVPRGIGFAVATLNFLVEDSGEGDFLVTTETRVHATDSSTRRKFRLYWTAIYPGSALIRRMWLKAIKRRAEQQSA